MLLPSNERINQTAMSAGACCSTRLKQLLCQQSQTFGPQLICQICLGKKRTCGDGETSQIYSQTSPTKFTASKIMSPESSTSSSFQNHQQPQYVSRINNLNMSPESSTPSSCLQNQQQPLHVSRINNLNMSPESSTTSSYLQNQQQLHDVSRIINNLIMSPETSTSSCLQNQQQPHHASRLINNLTISPKLSTTSICL